MDDVGWLSDISGTLLANTGNLVSSRFSSFSGSYWLNQLGGADTDAGYGLVIDDLGNICLDSDDLGSLKEVALLDFQN